MMSCKHDLLEVSMLNLTKLLWVTQRYNSSVPSIFEIN